MALRPEYLLPARRTRSACSRPFDISSVNTLSNILLPTKENRSEKHDVKRSCTCGIGLNTPSNNCGQLTL